ncbi:MAG: hypothetical protein JXA90_02940 [Planctomycetes bacterium]|nr:hypothetical protein [Planctomycetota bacterium]
MKKEMGDKEATKAGKERKGDVAGLAGRRSGAASVRPRPADSTFSECGLPAKVEQELRRREEGLIVWRLPVRSLEKREPREAWGNR